MTPEPLTPEPLTLERFATILDAYGGEAERWPVDEREAAAALLAGSPGARELRDRAVALDQLLERSAPLRPSPSLRQAILRTARANTRTSAGAAASDFWAVLVRSIAGWRVAGPVLAASLVLGVLTGGALDVGPTHAASADLLELTLLDDDFAGY